MQIDWIIAIMVFLIFTVWAFSYYSNLFPPMEKPLKSVVPLIEEKILNFLSVDVYEVPVYVNSSNSTTDALLYFNFSWPAGTKNSTRIYYWTDNQSLGCQITDNKLYWKADLSQGENYFKLKFALINTTLNCNSSFTIVNETLAEVWVQEKTQSIAQSKIEEMSATSYDDFKSDLGIVRDFNLTIEKTATSYGKAIPPNRDVHVVTSNDKIWDSGKEIEIRIAVW